MHRCPQGNFYLIATWYPQDPERYQQLSLPAGSYRQVIKLAQQVYCFGYKDLVPPDSIEIEIIKNSYS